VALLGHVIALQAGRDYESLVVDRICRPLGMDSTRIQLSAEMQGRFATGHDSPNVPARYFDDTHWPLPGNGSLRSTANDMLKLASALLGFNPSRLTSLLQHAYATHGGDTDGYVSSLVLDPVHRRGVVMLANSRNYVVRIVLNDLIKNQSPKPPATANINYKICDHYIGQYRLNDTSVWTVRREGSRLLVQKPLSPSYEVFPQSETNFLNQLLRTSYTFVPGTAGRAPQLFIDTLDDLDENYHARGARFSTEVRLP
jgi:CubicO group peptidase (beta-lactamase class C family)